MNVIETLGLSKTYGGGPFGTRVEALKNVSIDVGPGEAFGLLGPNGAGKTTLVKILLGLVHPSAGGALLLGEPAGSPKSRTHVGYMPERREYPDFLTAAQVLQLFGRLLGMNKRERLRRIDVVLEEVEMSAWRDHRVGGFSKGMQQRLALAQALLPDPQILFLDEPTEGIDPLGRVSIRGILRRNLEKGKTLFVNSHMLGEVELLCDRVAILVKGRVRREGPLSSLQAPNPEYRLVLATADDEVVQAALAADGQEAEALSAPPGRSAWRLSVGDRSELNATLDRIRLAGIEIEEVQRVRASLEEVFVQTISDASSEDSDAGLPGGAQSDRATVIEDGEPGTTAETVDPVVVAVTTDTES